MSVVGFLVVVFVGAVAASKPNVILIVADDLGWNDHSLHGSSQIPTPTLQRLADEGVLLTNYYVAPVCSPTRASLLTGRHVIHTGVYDPDLNGNQGDLSLNFTLWPQKMQKLGYHTAMVGKWHLGESSWRFSPLERGFDTYFGYLAGAEDYWTHHVGDVLDFWDEREPTAQDSCSHGNACDEETYSANVFARQAGKAIMNAAHLRKPLFLYMAFQSVHSPDEAPARLINRFSHTISNSHRRTFAGMVTALDDAVNNITKALKQYGMDNNTLIIFTTDNGGPADNFNGNMACNWPLRGMKRTLFEGGVRATGFVHGAGLVKAGYVSDQLIHVTDWMPSVLRFVSGKADVATDGEPPVLPGDGLDLWDVISGKSDSSARTWILHEAHPDKSSEGNGNSLRVGDWKIVIRSGVEWSTGSAIHSNDGWFGGPYSSDPKSGSYCVNSGDTLLVQCGIPPGSPPGSAFNDSALFPCEKDKETPCLFNIRDDPCELKDKSAENPEQLQAMIAALAQYRKTAVPTHPPSPDGHLCPTTKAVAGEKNLKTVWPCDNPLE